MSYSRNFGMRSFENIVRDGRFRAPVLDGEVNSEPFLIGAPVAVDPENAGYLKAAEGGDAPSQISGVVLFEHIQYQGVDTNLVSNHDIPFNQVPPGRYAQMIHGIGAKVWFKRTGNKPMYDGRLQENPDLLDEEVDFEAIAPGWQLVPTGDGTWDIVAGGDGVDGWLTVEQVNPSTRLVECRFNF